MQLNEAIVLAGGLGTRLRTVVADVPKPMAQVAGRPFLEHVLLGLQQQGIARCVLSVGYMADKIQAHFGGLFEGLQIDYAVEETPLGTGGGIFNAIRFTQTPYVLVTNGDTYYRANLQAMFELAVQQSASIVMAARSVPDGARYGVLEADPVKGQIQHFHNAGKAGPALINAGTYVLQAQVATSQLWAMPLSFEKTVVPLLVEQKTAYLVEDNAYFIDIGIPEDYARAQTELK